MHRIILTTGRISSEMLQKADRMGATFIISRTSPSSLSIQLARQKGITLVGYTRRDRFNVYAHSERIMLDPIKLQNQIQSNEDSIEAAHDKQNSMQTNQH